MAEDDPSGLNLLIQQRKNRPSYARMISSEMAKSSGDPPRKSGKSGKFKNLLHDREDQKESEGDSEGLGSQSEESEYFTADETFPENQDKTGDSEDDRNRIVDESCENSSFSLLKASSSTANREWKCGRSKRQKKRRCRQRREAYADYIPFHHEDDLTFSLSDLQEEVVNRAQNVHARVPFLFQLCVRTLWFRNSSWSPARLHLLPGPIKRASFPQRQTHALSSLQLSCFYQNLAQLESKINTSSIIHVTRNVWSKSYAVRWAGTEQVAQFFPSFTGDRMGSEDSMVIPYTYASFGLPDYENNPQQVDIRAALFQTSLMVSVLDLMTPSWFRPPQRKGTEAAGIEDQDSALVTCADFILKNLQKRYPQMVETFRTKSLLYFYWLRGHSRLALEHFIQLSHSMEGVLDKASILLEAAYLCQLQSQPESARKLYQQSHELLLDRRSVRSNTAIREQISEQCMVLCANTYDQGVLTEKTALQSLTAWQSLVTFPCCPFTALAATEAILCFHLSHLPGADVQEKVKLVMNHVKTCAGLFSKVFLHLSLLYAWLGNRRDSIIAYQRMVIDEQSPGQEFKPQDVRDCTFTPWQIVCDTVASKQVIHPLTVVWRTQLGHFRMVCDRDVFYGQQQARYGKLRVSPEGYLTDDLHLVLPPIRAVNLDLYTGKLILPSTVRQAHVHKALLKSWYGFPDSIMDAPRIHEFHGGSYALTSTELYSDSMGRQLHMLTSGAGRVLGVNTTVAHLEYTTATGQRTRMNLKEALKKELEKHVEAEVNSKCWRSADDSTGPSDHELALKGLQYAVSHNLFFSSYHDVLSIGKLVQLIRGPKMTKEQWKRKCKLWPKGSRQALKQMQLFEFQVEDFLSYGHTVFLRCTVNGLIFFFFVDTSSKETFISPVASVRSASEIHSSIYILGRREDQVPRSDLLCLVNARRDGKLNVYGQGGRCLVVKTADLRASDYQCVLGSSVYFMENIANRVPEAKLTLTEVRYQEEREPEIFVYDLGPEMQGVKAVADRLLLLQNDRLQVLNPDTMTPEPLLHDPNRAGQWPCPLSEDCEALLVSPLRVSVLAEKTVLPSADSPAVLVPVAVNDSLLMFSIQERCAVADPVVQVVFCVRVPGHTTECCFIGQSNGYVISTTLHREHIYDHQRETMCRLGPSGHLLSILPCLGPGPHSFCPFLLHPPASKDGEKAEELEFQSPTWHVYMRDGHEGIIAVKL